MGDLDQDTLLRPGGDGRYQAEVSRDWEMWGPLGGYMASLALRAASRESAFSRPVSFSCTYLSVASFEAVDIEVQTLRAGRTAAAHRVLMTQGDRTTLEARVWSANRGEGPDHTDCAMPGVISPGSRDMISDDRQARFPFTRNFHYLDAMDTGQRRSTAAWRAWTSFQPVACFEDPWLDACRSVIVLDASSFISASGRHGGIDMPYVAPSLDIHVTFHGQATNAEWLLVDTLSPVSREGLFGWRGDTWTADGALVATAIGQSLWKKL